MPMVERSLASAIRASAIPAELTQKTLSILALAPCLAVPGSSSQLVRLSHLTGTAWLARCIRFGYEMPELRALHRPTARADRTRV